MTQQTEQKTKRFRISCQFPASKIKRIMQSNEDIGKITKETPILVSKTLELFVQDLVTQLANMTQETDVKTISAYHLKQLVKQNKMLDFLEDIVEYIPDIEPEKTKKRKNPPSKKINASPNMEKNPKRLKTQNNTVLQISIDNNPSDLTKLNPTQACNSEKQILDFNQIVGNENSENYINVKNLAIHAKFLNTACFLASNLAGELDIKRFLQIIEILGANMNIRITDPNLIKNICHVIEVPFPMIMLSDFFKNLRDICIKVFPDFSQIVAGGNELVLNSSKKY